MPKATNKRKNVPLSDSDVAASQDHEEQPVAVQNISDQDNVIPPRLLKKLRRIPRLAELESMFEEPSSSADHFDLSIPGFSGGVQPANTAVDAATSSSHVSVRSSIDSTPDETTETDNSTSGTSDETTGTIEDPPTTVEETIETIDESRATADASTQNVDESPGTVDEITGPADETTGTLDDSTGTVEERTDTVPLLETDTNDNAPQNDNTPNIIPIDLTTEDNDVFLMLDKATNTRKSYKNKFRYKGKMVMLENINVDEGDNNISINLSFVQIQHPNVSRPRVPRVYESINHVKAQQMSANNANVTTTTVAVQAGYDENLKYRSGATTDSKHPKTFKTNVARISFRNGKYNLDLLPTFPNIQDDRVNISFGKVPGTDNTNVTHNTKFDILNLEKSIRPYFGKEKLGECPICLDKLNTFDLASTHCGHIFCLSCITKVVQSNNKKCPTCRKTLSKNSFHELYL